MVMKWIPAEANNPFTHPSFNKYFKVEPHEMTDCTGQNSRTRAISYNSACSAFVPGTPQSLRDSWIKQKMPLISQSLHPNAGDGKLPSKQIEEKHTFEVWQCYVEKETRRCDRTRSPECGAGGRRGQGNSLREDDMMTFRLRPEWWQIVSHVNIHQESRQPRRENPRLQTPVWSRLGYQFHRDQQTEVKGLTPTCTWTKGTHSGAFWEADQCFTFKHTRYHSTASTRGMASLFHPSHYAILKF